MEQHVAGYLFVERFRAQAVGAGQVQHHDGQLGRRTAQTAFLPLDRHAGVIAHLGAQTRQRVEHGRLAAIRIARQRNVSRLTRDRSGYS